MRAIEVSDCFRVPDLYHQISKRFPLHATGLRAKSREETATVERTNIHSPTHNQHVQTRRIQLLALPPTHQHSTLTIPTLPLQCTCILTYKMPKPLLRTKRQMHSLAPNNIPIHLSPQLERHLCEKGTLPLRMRARAHIGIRLRGQADCGFARAHEECNPWLWRAARGGGGGLLRGNIRGHPAHAGEEAKEARRLARHDCCCRVKGYRKPLGALR